METKRKYQVFISSTFTDLIDERQQIQNAILRMSHFPIGMELFSAASADQWTIIQQTIDCSDYYVLVIAYRYGSINDEGISYTQKEFEYAKRTGIPILAFIKKEDLPTTKGNIELSPEKREKLDDFISEVKTGRMVEWWETKDDLCQKVVNALYKEFDRSPRPGWVRADSKQVMETQIELVRQNKRIRKLESENQKLRAKEIVREPMFDVTVNGDKGLKLTLAAWDKKNSILQNYTPYDLEEMKHKGYTAEMLDEFRVFNANLPALVEQEAYVEAYREYELTKGHSSPFEICIFNQGTAKATNVIIDLTFPDSLRVYKKDKIKNISAPKAPKCPKRPEELRLEKSFFGITRANEILHTNLGINSPPPLTCLANSLTYDFDNDEWVTNNVLHICREEIMHTRCAVVSSYNIVPLSTGEFEVQGSIICEELPREIEFTIPVSVFTSET